jgi:hypothetical protein
MVEKSLWDEFNLGARNPDPGAGLLYCLRYSEDRIKAHQVAVVDALTSLGAWIDLAGEGVGVGFPDNFERDRARLLLEELSCLNEALEYSSVGFNRFDSVKQLKSGLMSSYLDLLSSGNMVGSYEMISAGIPQIVNDLRVADFQNKVLSGRDREELSDLVRFVKRQDHILNSPGQYVLFGSRNG